MTDDRTPPGDLPEEEDHDYHSQLEVDDTSGWRVFIVPVALIIFVIGGLLFIFLYQGDAEPDPRIANRFGTGAQTPAQQTQPEVLEPLGPPAVEGEDPAAGAQQPGLAQEPMLNQAEEQPQQ